MRIPKRHGLTRRYIAQFGLPLRSFVHSNDKAYYFARGERRRIADVKALFARYQLRDDDAPSTRPTITGHSRSRRQRASRTPSAANCVRTL